MLVVLEQVKNHVFVLVVNYQNKKVAWKVAGIVLHPSIRLLRADCQFLLVKLHLILYHQLVIKIILVPLPRVELGTQLQKSRASNPRFRGAVCAIYLLHLYFIYQYYITKKEAPVKSRLQDKVPIRRGASINIITYY